MKKYSRLKNLLASIFSIETGLSESQEIAALKRAACNEEWKKGIQEELLDALFNNSTSLINLLENDEYEVFSAETEEEAKDFFINRIWNIIYPENEL